MQPLSPSSRVNQRDPTPPVSPSKRRSSSSLAARAAAAADPTSPSRIKRTAKSAFFDYSPSSDSGSGFSSNSSSCPSSPALSSGASSTFTSPLGKMSVSSPKRRIGNIPAARLFADEVTTPRTTPRTTSRIPLPADDDDDFFFEGQNALTQSDEELIPNARYAVWGKEELLALGYTQKTVLSQTTDGQSLDELTRSLASGWDPNSSNSLTVIHMPDGQFVSMDNRRLFCLKKIANLAKRTLAIPVMIHDHREDADKKYLTPINADLKKSSITSKEDIVEKMGPHGIREDSYGFCAYARMRVFEKAVPDDCFGFTKNPIVRK